MKNYVLLVIFILSMSLTNIYSDAFEKNSRLGRGVNLGNALEAPNEGDWGVILQEEYFKLIADKGFNSVRIPVRWSSHTALDSPYTIDTQFLDRVDWAIQNSLQNGLCAVLNIHHFDSLNQNPDAYKDKFLAIWEQLSNHYKDYSDSLFFEILNEPNSNLTADKWNEYLSDALEIIRKSNPDRMVVIGTAEWGGINALYKLTLPPNDDNLILTVHYYLPFQFTHQGAEWVDGSDAWLGTTWDGTFFEKIEIIQQFEYIATYSKENNIPVFVGEFGAYSKADMASRVLWTEFCARLFERYGFSWTYWEFCSGFGIYDANTKTWRDSLVNALLSNDTSCLELDSVTIGDNLLKNGDFSQGKTHWTFGAWQGQAQGDVVNGEFKATVTETGDDFWNIQLLQDSLSIEKGEKYLCSFHAYTPDNENLHAAVSRSDNFVNYAETGTLVLTDEKKNYIFCFTASESFDKVRFIFSMGHRTGTVYIDDVIFAKISPTGIINKPLTHNKTFLHYADIKEINVARKGKIKFHYHVNNTCEIKLSIYTCNGKLLTEKNLGRKIPGNHVVKNWQGLKMPGSGSYLAVLWADGKKTSIKSFTIK